MKPQDLPSWNQGRNAHHDPASNRHAVRVVLVLVVPWISVALVVWAGVLLAGALR